MKNLLTVLLTFFSFTVFSQDTIQVMHYNLLNYGNFYSDCTTSTNSVSAKNIHLKTITKYVKPDILTVNEISDDINYHQMILDNVLNTDGVNYYRKAVSFNYAQSDIVNMLYYNSKKLVLYSQDVVHSALRDIDVVTLYYKSFDLAQTHDTIFVTCFLAHLKAGNGDTYEANRAGMVSTAMTYIRTHNLPDNKLFMGDLNLYTSNEQAYKNLVYEYSGIQYFFDPIQREGNWNNNYDFRDVHTQSTHSSNSPCFASGGLDDRFDIIMSSEALLQGTDKMQLLSNTYHALGNDGNHFNMNINDGVNSAAPEQIIEALFGMSDHLPVLTKIAVEATLGIEETNSDITAIRFQNPSPRLFKLSMTLIKPQMIKMEIYDIFGRLVFSQNQYFGQEYFSTTLSLNHLANGTYVLQLTDEKSNSISRKFVLKK